MIKTSTSRKTFVTFNTIFLLAFCLICLLPFANLLAISLSDNTAAIGGRVTFWPIGFNLSAYGFLLRNASFFRAFGISVLRVVSGTVLSLFVVVLCAFPLSRPNERFKARTFYVWVFAITMFFSGGLIPTFLVITGLKMDDTIFALIVPNAANAWNIVLLVNFFRTVPKDLEEYARTEGAGYFTILFKIILPVSLPGIATVVLFTAVAHWNSWFDGFIYMGSANYPLQTYIYNMINSYKSMTMKPNLSLEDAQVLKSLSEKTLRSAQIFIAMLPIMCVYPFAQKFFIKGLVMGSVKE